VLVYQQSDYVRGRVLDYFHLFFEHATPGLRLESHLFGTSIRHPCLLKDTNKSSKQEAMKKSCNLAIKRLENGEFDHLIPSSQTAQTQPFSPLRSDSDSDLPSDVPPIINFVFRGDVPSHTRKFGTMS